MMHGQQNIESDRVIIILLYNAVDRPKFVTAMYVETLGRFNTRDARTPTHYVNFFSFQDNLSLVNIRPTMNCSTISSADATV
jgi:hypothetical protein